MFSGSGIFVISEDYLLLVFDIISLLYGLLYEVVLFHNDNVYK